jgi:hypothetical protein
MPGSDSCHPLAGHLAEQASHSLPQRQESGHDDLRSSRLLKFYSCGAIARQNRAQNAHLHPVNCAFSPNSSFSRTRLSEFQQPARYEPQSLSRHAADHCRATRQQLPTTRPGAAIGQPGRGATGLRLVSADLRQHTRQLDLPARRPDPGASIRQPGCGSTGLRGPSGTATANSVRKHCTTHRRLGWRRRRKLDARHRLTNRLAGEPYAGSPALSRHRSPVPTRTNRRRPDRRTPLSRPFECPPPQDRPRHAANTLRTHLDCAALPVNGQWSFSQTSPLTRSGSAAFIPIPNT